MRVRFKIQTTEATEEEKTLKVDAGNKLSELIKQKYQLSLAPGAAFGLKISDSTVSFIPNNTLIVRYISGNQLKWFKTTDEEALLSPGYYLTMENVALLNVDRYAGKVGSSDAIVLEFIPKCKKKLLKFNF